MSFSQIQHANVVDGLGAINASKTYSAGQKLAIDESIPDSSSDLEVALALDVTAVKAFYMISDVDMLIEPNSASVPDDPISLLAGVPYVWTEDSYDAFFFGTDWTSIFITTGSVGAGRLQIRALVDPTP